MKEIQLTQGFVALVDDEDYDYLMQWKWYAKKQKYSYYANRYENGKLIHMHRVILKIDNPNLYGDHKDHNGLNNQRKNLRIATKLQNNKNKTSHKNAASRFLGVSSHNERWRARITINYKNKSLGVFKSESEAAMAYNNAARVIHGEFANLNNI